MNELGRVRVVWGEMSAARRDASELRAEFLRCLLLATEAGYTQGNIGERIGMSRQRVGQLLDVARQNDRRDNA